ncbi:MAG: hypothetical protein ACNYPD_07945 [Candidatus Halichondribacter symbioticus]
MNKIVLTSTILMSLPACGNGASLLKRGGDNTACPNPNRVCYTDWVDNFANTPDSERKNQFLQETEDGVNNGDITEAINTITIPAVTIGGTQITPPISEETKTPVDIKTLTFFNTTHGGVDLDGDPTDGVAYFYGSSAPDVHHYYAGILSGTNLGAPVGQTGTAEWQGQIGWSSALGSSLPTEPMDFTLSINFADSTINGQVDLANSLAFVVSGSFTPRGLITGTTSYDNNGNDNDGTLRGLIGEQGAVAAFISNADASDGYSGGFVVCAQIPCLTDE